MNHQVTEYYDSESIHHDSMAVASLDWAETKGGKN